MVRILREYERGVIFRLGKLLGTKGPGIIFLIPLVDRMVKMDLRVVTIDVSRQEMMTRDNVPVSVDAVVYFRVVDAEAAVVKVENENEAPEVENEAAEPAVPAANMSVRAANLVAAFNTQTAELAALTAMNPAPGASL